MDARRVIVIILAYGLWGTNERSPKEIVGYGMYLKECANALRHLVDCGYYVDAILCGGAKSGGVTEAESMFQYLSEATEDINIHFEVEKSSLSTPANIWEAYKRIEAMVKEDGGGYEPRILLICDSSREFKVRWLVECWQGQAKSEENRSCNHSWSPRRTILSWVKPEIVAFSRPDINSKSTKIYQFFETLAMMLVPRILNDRINKLR